MSRYDGDYSFDYDEPFPNAGALYAANAERALKGKRGRRVLAELREALLALPEKRLISSALCTVGAGRRLQREIDEWGYLPAWRLKMTRDQFRELLAENNGEEGVCAVGALLWHRKVVKDGLSPEEAFDALPTLNTDEGGLEATAEVAKEAGIVYSLAWQLAYRNDEMFDGMSPEERYDAFLAWLDQELATPAVGG
jgi:hypothetical protein